MSVIHPSPAKLAALRERWVGQERRLQRIATSMLALEDWTVHLRGLPHVDEIPPIGDEAYGRDLRGADLRRFLHPTFEVRDADEREAAVVAGLTLEAMRNNTPLPEASPFPVEFEGVEEMAVAMRRGERFLLARAGRTPVGVIRLAKRVEFQELTGHQPYAEISGLAVHPAWRRNGIGKALIEAAEAHAREDGQRFALLRTTEELGLVTYYERLGYEQRLLRQLSYPGSPTFIDTVMTKSLKVRRGTPGGRRPLGSVAAK